MRTYASKQKGRAMATATCQLYSVQAAPKPSCLSQGILDYLEDEISETPTASEMNKFFDTFGTHTIDKMNMGAKYVTTS